MLARFRPRPTFANVVSLLALFIALGGGALAASKFVGSDGVIHGCVTSKGKVTLVKAGKSCKKKGTPIAWNQRGPRGRAGRNGATKVTVRTTNATVHYACTDIATSYLCNAQAAGTAHCGQGEVAVGGGGGMPADGGAPTLQQTKPSPTTGRPTGWSVTATVTKSSATPTPADSTMPIHADCAAP